MKYFDSHAHYYDERFCEEYAGSVDDLIDALMADNISHIINVGTCPDTCLAAIAQAKKHGNMYTALGIHPSDTRFLTDMESELAQIEEMILDPASKCVCLGEIGLDYHYEDSNKDRQLAYFEEQMKMAGRLGLPVSIHDRDAHGDVLEVLRRHSGVRGILHSFSGSAEMAEELVKLGYMISFSGTITFKNARKPKEAAVVLPKDMVLIETDCPYLAPHPKRGSLNHSGNLVYTNAALASVLGIGEEECAKITADNAKRIFGL